MSEYCILISLKIIQTRHYVWQPKPPFFLILNHVFYLLLLVSLTLCPGVRILPFFSQIRWGSGTPWATQLNTALPPAVLDTDCGHCRNSGGAEEETEQDRARGLSVWTRKITSSAHQVLPWQRRYLYLQIYVLCGGLQIHTKEDESIYKIDDITWIFCTVQPTEIQSNTCLLKPKTEWHYWIITLWHIALYFTAGH